MNISQTEPLIIINSFPSLTVPIPHEADAAPPAVQAKTLESSLTSLFHTPHPMLQQILLFLPSKPIPKPTTSCHLHCYHLGSNPQQLFFLFFKQPPCPCPHSVCSQVGQRSSMKMKIGYDKHLPKTFQWLSFSLTEVNILTVAYEALQWSGLVSWHSPVLTILMSNVMSTRDTFLPQGLCMYFSHYQKCSSPQYKQGSFCHLLQVSNMTYDILTQPFQASPFKSATVPCLPLPLLFWLYSSS